MEDGEKKHTSGGVAASTIATSTGLSLAAVPVVAHYVNKSQMNSLRSQLRANPKSIDLLEALGSLYDAQASTLGNIRAAWKTGHGKAALILVPAAAATAVGAFLHHTVKKAQDKEDAIDANAPHWDVPGSNTARPGIFTRFSLGVKATEPGVKKNDIWDARSSDTREAALIALRDQAAHDLNITKPPKLVMFKSQWPEAIYVNSGHLAVSTGLADTLKPAEMKAMMVQQLEAEKHATKRFIMKWPVDIGVIYAVSLGLQTLAAKKWKFLDLKPIGKEIADAIKQEGLRNKLQGVHNATQHPTFRVTASVLTMVKATAWEGLQIHKDRKHEFEQDQAAAKIEGVQPMLDALTAIEKREHALDEMHADKKYTRKLPQSMQHSHSTAERIAALKKDAPESFVERVNAQENDPSAPPRLS